MLCCGEAREVIAAIVEFVNHGYSDPELGNACDLLNAHVALCPLCSGGVAPKKATVTTAVALSA